MVFTVTQQDLLFLKSFGYTLTPVGTNYKTVGYTCQFQEDIRGRRWRAHKDITADELDSLLQYNISTLVPDILASVIQPLTHSMVVALYSYVSSVGLDKWMVGRVLKFINKRNYVKAATYIQKDCKVYGKIDSDIQKRRYREYSLFLSEDEFKYNLQYKVTRGITANNLSFNKDMKRFK